jgi:hypothetical protein
VRFVPKHAVIPLHSAPQHAAPQHPAAQHAAAQHAGPVGRVRRVRGKWVALVAVTAGVLVPGVGYATSSMASPASASHSGVQLASQSSAAQSGAAQSSAAGDSCRGVHQVAFPAVGFITNPERSQGGHTWWLLEPDGSVCIGTVAEWVQYNVSATRTWQVIVYSAQHPQGQVVDSKTFTLSAGWYLFGFKVRQAYQGLTKVCITANDTFGTSCIHFT